jgi:phage shock protein PspC (stress-responsive transcriptional regulator)
MLIVRLLFILSAVAIILSGGMYVLTRNRRYLKLAWQIVRFVLIALLVFAALFILERYVLIAWNVLL